MAEADERPSKIRKLEPISDGHGPEDEITLSGALTEKLEDVNKDAVHGDSLGDINGASVNRGHADDAIGAVELQPTSKNQLKKLKKKQAWEEGRDLRRARRREHNKQKKARKAEQRVTTAEESLLVHESSPNLPTRHVRAVQLPITLIIDCDFDELMTDKEIVSLGTQITRSYSDNRSAPFRAHFVVSSFQGHLRERFETVLSNNHLGWKAAKLTEDDFVQAAQEAHLMMQSEGGGELFGAFARKPGDAVQVDEANAPDITKVIETPESWPEQCKPAVEEPSYSKEMQSGDVDDADAESRQDISTEARGKTEPSIVYLTSDSPHTLDRLEPYTTYIIGGIVDKNRHKGICYKRARERNLRTAKLPIGDYMKMQSRTVLATNHVVEIMVRWLEDGDWGRAFLRVIPKRKEAKLKANASTLYDREDELGQDGSEQEELSAMSG